MNYAYNGFSIRSTMLSFLPTTDYKGGTLPLKETPLDVYMFFFNAFETIVLSVSLRRHNFWITIEEKMRRPWARARGAGQQNVDPVQSKSRVSPTNPRPACCTPWLSPWPDHIEAKWLARHNSSWIHTQIWSRPNDRANPILSANWLDCIVYPLMCPMHAGLLGGLFTRICCQKRTA